MKGIMNVLDLENPKAVDPKLSGGKGSSLAFLSQKGFRVPPGFIITTSVFDSLLGSANLRREIHSGLEALDLKSPCDVEQYSDKTIKKIVKLEIPNKVKDEIINQYNHLNLSITAVRSSAVSEDSNETSWAGQLESYLGITSERISEYVKKCWASQFAQRALMYRLKNNLQNAPVSMAVLVQEIVPSEVSGVCFTIHPVSLQRRVIYIEAVYGMGESLVSGEVTPDSYTVERDSNAVLSIETSKQEQQVSVSKSVDSSSWTAVPSNLVSKPKLSYSQIQKLAQTAIDIEDSFDSPQDIEWGIQSNDLYMLQSRPITSI